MGRGIQSSDLFSGGMDPMWICFFPKTQGLSHVGPGGQLRDDMSLKREIMVMSMDGSYVGSLRCRT